VQDLDASDFTLDLLLENTSYLTNLATGNAFNITQYDMVLLKTGTAAGVAGAIHAFATKGGGSNGVPSALFQSVQSAKLTSPDGTDAGGGSFHYPLNPDKQLTDYNGAKGAISKSTALNWGYGFGTANTEYIQALRNTVLAPPTALAAVASGNSVALSWTDNATDETGFEVFRSTDGVTYTRLTTVGTNITNYADSCLSYATRYYYKVRTTGQDLVSGFAAAVNTNTGNRPALTLSTLTGACSVTAVAPIAPDNCDGTATATTTDPTTYTAQGAYTINWLFAYSDGSTSTATQQVVVSDETAPTVRTQNIVVQLDATGHASVTAEAIDNGSSDECGIQFVALSKTTFDCADAGPNTVTLTVTDVNGNVAAAEATVTVQDNVAPLAAAKNILVTLANGSAVITAADVDNGSSDACGIQSLQLDKTSFDCSSIGPNTVRLTATDTHGNSATATATVTVIGTTPAPAIAISRTDNTFTGLPNNTIALGYAAQSLVLTATNSTSASTATTYAWSPATGLSNANSANPVFTPTSAGTYTFTVLATNEFGCSGSRSVSITVLDVRCSNNLGKVLVCHNGQQLCLPLSAVGTHLVELGDQLGNCTSSTARTAAGNSQQHQRVAAPASVFEAYPNPFTTRTTIRFRPVATGAAQVQVFNHLGQLVTTLYNATAEAGRYYELSFEGAALPAGLYTCRLLLDGKATTQRLVLVK
jgi:PKD repeat protein